ncbi:hypothetical protein KEM55_001564, partial [Ascosphaera atra]
RGVLSVAPARTAVSHSSRARVRGRDFCCCWYWSAVVGFFSACCRSSSSFSSRCTMCMAAEWKTLRTRRQVCRSRLWPGASQIAGEERRVED